MADTFHLSEAYIHVESFYVKHGDSHKKRLTLLGTWPCRKCVEIISQLVKSVAGSIRNRQILTPSANNFHTLEDLSDRSLTYTMKNSDPSTLPWGTPLEIELLCDNDSPILTLKVLSDKSHCIHLSTDSPSHSREAYVRAFWRAFPNSSPDALPHTVWKLRHPIIKKTNWPLGKRRKNAFMNLKETKEMLYCWTTSGKWLPITRFHNPMSRRWWI